MFFLRLKKRFLDLSISKKIVYSLLLCGIAPMFFMEQMAVRQAEGLLQQQAFSQLEAVTEIKKNAVERYFSQVRSQVLTMSTNRMVVESMQRFSMQYDRLMEREGYDAEQLSSMRESVRSYYHNEFEAKYLAENDGKSIDIDALVDGLSDRTIVFQYDYISNNANPLGDKHLLDRSPGDATYHSTHAKVHPVVRQYLLEFGYYDIFFVNADSGDIVYSVYKELDFATSLVDGPYSKTNFAEAFSVAASKLKKGEVVFRDFRPYTPSYEAPASFIATPIFSGDRKVGVPIFQMPLEPVNTIMSDRSGMGETGESYLVGSDYLMRSDSYLNPENHNVAASFRDPESGSVKTDAVMRALEGTTGSDIIVDYDGNTVLSSYGPLDINGETWVVISEIGVAEAFAPAASLTRTMLTIGVFVFLLILVFSSFVAKMISKPISTMSMAIQDAERTGDFSVVLAVESNDEIGKTTRAFQGLLRMLSSSLDQTNNVLGSIAKGDFSHRISENYNGQLAQLASGVNSCVAQLEASTEEQRKQAERAKVATEDAQTQAEAAKASLAEAEQQAKVASESKAESERQAALAAEQTRLAKLASEQAELAAIEAGRVKQALDCVSTNTMIADKDLNIIYTNKSLVSMLSVAESDIRKDLPQFAVNGLMGGNIDQFHKNPQHQRHLLRNLTGTHEAEIEVGGRTFKLVVNPIIGDDGATAGSVVEWADRTAEVAIEKEIDDLVEAAVQGDFSNVIDLRNKTGFFRRLSEGLNKLVQTSEASLGDIAKVLEYMAAGTLTQRINADYQGSFGRLKNDTNATLEKLTEVIGGISSSANEVATGAKEIALGNMDLSQRTEEQASSLDQTRTSVEKIAENVQQNSVNASECYELAINAGDIAGCGGEIVNSAVQAMEDINQSSNKIGDIIGVIDEIAFQTNLLALNAAVEAARAGEQGRGFAVVAGEVRNLAQRSATAAREIKGLINESLEKIQGGTSLVNESGDSLLKIVSAVNNVSAKIDQINRSASEQALDIKEIKEAVGQMDNMTQQNAALVEEATAASDAMAKQAGHMESLTAFFKR